MDEQRLIAAELEALGYVLYGERIAVIRDKGDEKSEGGIIIPEIARRRPIRGTVVMVGLGIPDEDHDLAGLRIGDRVTFTKYNPILFELMGMDGKRIELEVMHAADIYIGWREKPSPPSNDPSVTATTLAATYIGDTEEQAEDARKPAGFLTEVESLGPKPDRLVPIKEDPIGNRDDQPPNT